MRGLVMAIALAAAVATAPQAGRAETPATAGGADPAVGSWYGASAGATATAPDTGEVVRTMYVTMGAMAGYMFAVMPVTSAAVTAAVASGVASMWAYDYMLAPAAEGAAAQ